MSSFFFFQFSLISEQEIKIKKQCFVFILGLEQECLRFCVIIKRFKVILEVFIECLVFCMEWSRLMVYFFLCFYQDFFDFWWFVLCKNLEIWNENENEM